LFTCPQEKATHLYYRALAKALDEALLKAILTKMGADEASTGRFSDTAHQCHKGDLGCPGPQISAVSEDFKMPVQSNLTKLPPPTPFTHALRARYKHADVFTDMMSAIERAGRNTAANR